MKKHFLSLAFTMTTFCLFAYQNPSFDYNEAWAKVNKATNDQLPKTALEEVDKIVTTAFSENNTNESLKAFVYKTRLILHTEELGLEKVIESFDTAIADSQTPVKQLLQSAMAELMANYFNNNYYIISRRTDIADYIPTDIRTWSPNQYRAYISNLYLSSVSDTLSEYPTDDYLALLYDAERVDIELRPSLYELVLDRALQYFTYNNLQGIAPSFRFKLDDEAYYATADKFARLEINSIDSSSLKLKAIQLYQKAITKQLDNPNQKALHAYDLMRLAFVNQHAELSNKSELLIEAYAAAQDGYTLQVHKDAFQYHTLQAYHQIGKVEHAISIAIELNTRENIYAIQARNWLKSIYNPYLSISSENIFSSSENIKLKVNYNNLKDFHISLYEADGKQFNRSGDQEQLIESIISRRRYFTQHILADSISYHSQTKEISLAPQKIGHYLVVLHSKENLKADSTAIYYGTIQVSNLFPSFYRASKKDYFILRDRKSGEPIEGTIYLEEWKYNRKSRKEELVKSYKNQTNKDGFFIIPPKYYKNRNWKVRFEKGDDQFYTNDNVYFNKNGHQGSYESVEFFLDRSIYRPGQTVYFKGLNISYDENRVPSIKSDNEVTVSLYDANSQELSKLELKTNEYGSVNGSFILPEGLLTGNFYIRTGSSYKYFSVEEYKRPTFEVSFEEQEADIKLGQEVTIKGTAKAYSGAKVNDAKVEYTVYRELRYYWRWWNPNGTKTQNTKGEITTDKDGKFEFTFKADKDNSVADGENPSYYYSIEANVTDINGETRSANTGINVSVVPYYFKTNLSKIYDIKDLDSLEINAIRNTGEATSSSAIVKIAKLISPDQWQRPDQNKNQYRHYNHRPEAPDISTILKDYAIDKEILSKEININEEGFTMDLKSFLSEGSYKVSVISKDTYDGAKAEYSHYFIVNNYKKEKIEPAILLYTKGQESLWKVGKDIEIQLASAVKDLHVYYAFLKDQKIKKEGWIKLDQVKTLKYSPDIHDKGGISLHLDYNYKNFFNQKNLSINIPWQEKVLDIHMTSFRSILEPGSKEKWTLKVTGQGKDRVAAEMLASMYDKSLDQYKAHGWNWNGYPSHFGNLNMTLFHSRRGGYSIVNYQWNRLNTEPLTPRKDAPRLDFSFATYYVSGFENEQLLDEISVVGYKVPLVEADNSTQGRARSARSLPTKNIQGIAATSAGLSSDESGNISVRGSRTDATFYYIDGVRVSGNNALIVGGDSEPNFDFEARKNLAETVFFYPELKTDQDGNILLDFTMNEALTTWKLMCFAHDKSLRYGFSSEEVKTQKELMIQPNAPRFLREGDLLRFPAKISNLSTDTISATARLEITDATNNLSLDDSFLTSDQQVTIHLAPGASEAVHWNLAVPKDFKSTVKYVVKVSSDKHTDGEENILPVVTNRKLVTETKVFHLKKQEATQLDVSQLTNLSSTTASPYSLTLEYTANPVWYAVQALPYIVDYPHDCTEQIFHRFYANALAHHIATASPKIQEIFNLWKEVDTEAFLSNLDKNKELKYAILEETPWVRQAQSEQEQKKRIALLFDFNKMSAERSKELTRLVRRQLPSGGFPWFQGGREDVYITQMVIEGIIHLNKLGVEDLQDRELSQIVTRAMEYLHEQSKKRYDDLVERAKKYGLRLEDDHLDHLSIQYLYICSFDPELSIPNYAKTAYNYYHKQSIKYWKNKTLMTQALIGISLYRTQEDSYKNITASLKEKSFYSAELGRYWNLGNGFRWYELPIESHATLIEYFTEIGDQAFHEDLKIWLLKNKQTNHWSTTKSTARAIYALLISGEQDGMTKWIDESNTPDLKIDQQVQDVAAWGPEAGTGYIKKTWTQGEDIPQQIEIKNNNETIAWGAVYNQYFEQLDKIKSYADNPLFIDRKLFIERKTDYGPQLELITDTTKLVAGDRIMTRITIKTDRSMSYVHLKDMRGSGMEPENVLSSYKYQGSFGYYESTRDLASHFFISRLPKGTHVFEYPVRVVHAGSFSSGIATLQCMYAPEFTSHSEGEVINVGIEE